MLNEAGPLTSYRPEFNSLLCHFHLPCNLGHISETLWTSVFSSVTLADQVTPLPLPHRVFAILYVNAFKQCLVHQGPPQTAAMTVMATAEFEIQRQEVLIVIRKVQQCGASRGNRR